jgi:hypothetical protein
VYVLTCKRRQTLLKLEMHKSLISEKENAAMTNDKTIPFQNPGFRDEMTDLIRAHAQEAIRRGVLAELEAF